MVRLAAASTTSGGAGSRGAAAAAVAGAAIRGDLQILLPPHRRGTPNPSPLNLPEFVTTGARGCLVLADLQPSEPWFCVLICRSLHQRPQEDMPHPQDYRKVTSRRQPQTHRESFTIIGIPRQGL